MKPLLISSGEPAGIGPDICLSLAGHPVPLVVAADPELLRQRAAQLGLDIQLQMYMPDTLVEPDDQKLTVMPVRCPAFVQAGKLDLLNAAYVLELLTQASNSCLAGEFSALVTAPVNKAIINAAGFQFTGHTEFLSAQCHAPQVVMLLCCPAMKVALLTTHLPLKDVPQAITRQLIIQVTTTLNQALKKDFGIREPRIFLAGLNPHAGEGGFLGREELDVIEPAVAELRMSGIRITGPLPADTMFSPQNANNCDVFLAVYHDQGLSVLKYAGFGQAVNVTLGLPILRTSVDHGTALDLAGSGLADPGSLMAAVDLAATLAARRAV